jgi:DNA-binding response OmpR family regulator
MDGAKPTILIIEDDEFLRTLAAKRLEKEGYLIAVAVDGESALNVTLETKPALILLDLLLPGLDGFQVLEKIRGNDQVKAVPVIVFSNLGRKEDIERARQLGADDFLIKANFTLDDLAQKINAKLGKA